jgi:uncharacterized Tic20 family protein
MSIADELQKLQQLHQSGAISDDEFAKAKATLLGRPASAGPGSFLGIGAGEHPARQWAMFLHLSQLANFLVPPAGLVLPIVIWQMKKAELPEIDAHGKIVANWIISALIYFAVCIPLAFIVIGYVLMPILGALGVIFPVIGALKANNGELWKYPLSISFFK